MAIAPLIVSIRTFGARQLRNLGTDFRQLAANIRVAYNRFIMRGGIPGWIRRLPGNLRQIRQAAIGAAAGLLAFAAGTRAAQAAAAGLTRMMPQLLMYLAAAGLAVGLLVPLTGIIGNLLGAIQLVAPAAGAAALAMVTLKLAFQGVGEALEAGLSGDTEAYEKALKNLAPSARTAVGALVMLRNEWKRTQKAVQQRFFEGFAADVAATSRAIQPLADKWLPRIAGSFQEMINGLASGLQRWAKSGEGEAVFRNLSLAIDNVTRAVGPLAQAFGDILSVASPRFEQLTADGASLAQSFADWIREAKESGKLGEWLDKAITTLDKIKEIGGNVLGIFQGIFRAGEDDGQALLDKLIGITETWERFSKSTDGQKTLDAIAKTTDVMIASAPVWEFMLNFISLTIAEFRILGEAGKAAWDGLKVALQFFVDFAVNAFVAILNAAIGAFGWIPGLGDKLQAAKEKVAQFQRDTNNLLNGINDKHITVTVERKLLGPSLGGIFGYRGLATGGFGQMGRTYLVGEQGPELVTFGGNGYVHDADATRRMLAGEPRPGFATSGASRGGAPMWVGGPPGGLDALFLTWLNKMVRSGRLRFA